MGWPSSGSPGNAPRQRGAAMPDGDNRVVRPVRCAIYTRKSSEEGLDRDFNSLDAQREAAEGYIRSQQAEGWIALPEAYNDGGFTGANMERPALSKLLRRVLRGSPERSDFIVITSKACD